MLTVVLVPVQVPLPYPTVGVPGKFVGPILAMLCITLVPIGNNLEQPQQPPGLDPGGLVLLCGVTATARSRRSLVLQVNPRSSL